MHWNKFYMMVQLTERAAFVTSCLLRSCFKLWAKINQYVTICFVIFLSVLWFPFGKRETIKYKWFIRATIVFSWIILYKVSDILVFVLLRFSPELLGVQASSALVWLIMEVLAVLLSLYLVTVNTDLTTIDLLAFSGYKYVGYVQGCAVVGIVSFLFFIFNIHLRFPQNDCWSCSRASVWEASLLSLFAMVLCCHFCLYGE